MNTRAIGSLLLLFASLSPAAHAQSGQASVSLPSTQLQFAPSGVKDGSGRELMVGPAYGDLARGPHGSFVKMPAGFSSLPHIHTGDYWGVVVTGVAVNGPPSGSEVPLPAGSYWFQKGGEKHVTKCVSANECLLFISQVGKFDYVIDKASK